MSASGDFGHIAMRVFIDTWGVGPFVIEANDKQYRFEDSDRFGPALLKANGDPRTNPYPQESSPFWRAHYLWKRQGREVRDGLCVWREPKPNLLRREGNEVIVVECGEDDGLDLWADTLKPVDMEKVTLVTRRKETP